MYICMYSYVYVRSCVYMCNMRIYVYSDYECVYVLYLLHKIYLHFLYVHIIHLYVHMQNILTDAFIHKWVHRVHFHAWIHNTCARPWLYCVYIHKSIDDFSFIFLILRYLLPLLFCASQTLSLVVCFERLSPLPPPPLKGLECLVSEWARQSVSSVDRAATWWGRLHGRGGGVLVLPVLLAATSRLLIVCVAVPET